jgi:hypothetical protein
MVHRIGLHPDDCRLRIVISASQRLQPSLDFRLGQLYEPRANGESKFVLDSIYETFTPACTSIVPHCSPVVGEHHFFY